MHGRTLQRPPCRPSQSRTPACRQLETQPSPTLHREEGGVPGSMDLPDGTILRTPPCPRTQSCYLRHHLPQGKCCPLVPGIFAKLCLAWYPCKPSPLAQLHGCPSAAIRP